MTVVPYKEETLSKKDQVAKMFNSISHRYDFLNHFLSLGIDRLWRKQAVNYLKPFQPKIMLDVATGTGDFALEALSLNPGHITGIDISEGMLDFGRKKIEKLKLNDRVELKFGDSENIPFAENKFDAITVGFGVRNFENLEKGVSEMYRVLKPGGILVVLEFSRPKRFPVKQLYNFYFNFVLPKIGNSISSDKAAYSYLPESVAAFPDGKDFEAVLQKIGFKQTTCKPLTFGISSIYTGQK